MERVEEVFTGLVVALALASVLILLRRPRKSTAELLFAVFCGSLALSLLGPVWSTAPTWALLLLAVGGCATCNAYWLVARALFRGEGGVGPAHLAAAASVAVLIVAYRALKTAGAGGLALSVLGELLTLASSTVLVLAFAEALRGYRAAAAAERRLRLGFMAVYGGCVLLGTLSGALASSEPAWLSAHRLVVLSCALSILVFTHIALELRRRSPERASPVVSPAPAPAPAGVICQESQALAVVLVAALEVDRLYRQPELKVADLAAHVGSKEHRVSRVINQVLGAANFNQWVNRYRIEHACRLLQQQPRRSVLDISLDAGFGSLGPFNRAFKAAMGCTPSEWRVRARQPAPPRSTADDSLAADV
ncbi:MAG: AraC family transcriptional regulator [Xanthomonadales bacterium]|nr:AraC family transcriptional regulator [Xanthomonadales bacterium]